MWLFFLFLLIFVFFFFKQKTAYEIRRSLVGSEMYIRDRSVTIPACDPVREIASGPRSEMAMARRAADMRSPVERSMSISRAGGSGEISRARAIKSSVVSPRADITATTEIPSFRAATIRRAALFTRSASATEVPPNFMTMVLDGTAFSSCFGVIVIGSEFQEVAEPGL